MSFEDMPKLGLGRCLQNGSLPLSNSLAPSHIIENTDVFDFEIIEDKDTIHSMPYLGASRLHPDEVEF